MHPIHKFGTEEQKHKYLPGMATGEIIGCFGLTEPDYGSNPGGMVTKAEKVDGGYILNGAKMWITNGTIADLAIVWAKLDGVIRGFIVEKDDKGFTATEQKGKPHSVRLLPLNLFCKMSSSLMIDIYRVQRVLVDLSHVLTVHDMVSLGVL